MAQTLSTVTKNKIRKAAVERWGSLTPEEQKNIKDTISTAMKDYWRDKTPEERAAIGRKAAATRKANKAAKLKEKRNGD